MNRPPHPDADLQAARPSSTPPPSSPGAGAVLEPNLKYLATVALRFDTPRSIGETPDGIRLEFEMRGTIDGPVLQGTLPPCTAYLIVDVDAVGLLQLRAPVVLSDGAVAELEATGRYNLGPNGYERAVGKDLPTASLGCSPRFFTASPRYLWLNRVVCLGVGQLRPRDGRLEFDLFAVMPTAG